MTDAYFDRTADRRYTSVYKQETPDVLAAFTAFDSAVFATHLPSGARSDVAFHSLNSVGTRDETVYGAQYWACMYPCRCHTQRVTTISVRLRASVSGKDFAVRLFHSQLQAGLSRRFRRLGFRFSLG